MKSKFTTFIERKYLEWQLKTGGRQSIQAFATYLGVSQPLLSTWLNGSTKTPSPTSLYKLAQKLGNEVFELFDIVPPDPLLNYIITSWDRLSQENQHAIREKVELYLSEKPKASHETDQA